MCDSDAVESQGDGWFTVIGDLVEDVVVWTTAPARRGTDNPATVHRTRGGSAANTAVLAAADVPTRLVCRVGTDPTGTALVDQVRAAGVDVQAQYEGRTGTVVVLVDPDGERTMYPDRATAADLAHVPDPWLEGTVVMHAPAYGLMDEPMASALVDAADRVRRAGGEVSIDLSAASLIESYGVTAFRALLERVAPEVVLANADEAAAIDLAAMTPWRVFVVKDGPRPARVLERGHEWVSVPAAPVEVVRDTTGAGDAFTAGFLPARMRGAGLVEAVQAGHRRAASILGTPGAVPGT